jgi:hypothetical protein
MGGVANTALTKTLPLRAFLAPIAILGLNYVHASSILHLAFEESHLL